MPDKAKDNDVMDAGTAGPVFQEVIRPFSTRIAALNADRSRVPVSRCMPLTSREPSRPGRVAEVARHPGSVKAQPGEPQQQQGKPRVSSLNRSHESKGAAAAGGTSAELGATSETGANASVEPSALDEDLSHLQQQLPPRDTPPATPTPALTDTALLYGAPSRARLGAAGSQTHTAGGQLLRQPARKSLWQDVSKKLHSAPNTGRHDIKASQLPSCLRGPQLPID